MKRREEIKLKEVIGEVLDRIVPKGCTYLVQFFGPEHDPYWLVCENSGEEFTSESVRSLIQKTIETMHEYAGK
jgi:hypothetical protein